MRTSGTCLLCDILLCAFLVFPSCSEDSESDSYQDYNLSPTLTPQEGDDSAIDSTLFTVINLDYPGLEKVKEYYEEGEYYYAASALLSYYRDRGTVFNPGINLLTTTATVYELNKADQALADNDYRFCVSESSMYESYDEDTGLYTYYSFSDGNGGINWDYQPDDVEDENEWNTQKHRHIWMIYQALAYRATGDETYVTDWINTYSDWLETYPCPEGTTTSDKRWFGLQTACRAIDQPDIMMYTIQSENFTPEWLSTFLVAFATHIENIRDNWYSDSSSNIRIKQEAAVTKAAILMPEFLAAEDWLADGSTAMGSQVSDQFNDDGVQNELDPSYHISVLADFYDTFKIAEANDMLSYFPDNYTDYLHSACLFVRDIIYPDYSIDNFNDTRSVSWTLSVLTRNFKYYLDMFPDDDTLRWFATQGSSGSEPEDLITVYPTSGYYMMRNGWESTSTMLVLKNNYNPDDKWHCQPDNGTIGLYKNGRRFLPDAGVYTYETGSTRTSYQATKVHNTMTRELADIEAPDHTQGRFLGQFSGSNYDAIVTENDSYDDLTHRRAVFFVNETFFVLVDEGYGSAADVTVNLNFNLWARTSEAWADMVDEYDDLSYGAHSIFSDNNNMLFKTFCETSTGYAESYNSGYYSDAIGERQQRMTYRVDVTKESGLAARFITVIYPFSAESDFDSISIDASFIDNVGGTAGTFHEDGASVSVTVNNTTYYLSYTL